VENLFGSVSTQLVSGAALTLIHFIWQAAVVAIVLKLLLAIVPQKYLLTRYRLAVTALVITVAFPCFSLYYLMQSPDMLQSSIDYSAKAISLLEELPELQAPSVQDTTHEISKQTTSGVALSGFEGLSRNELLLNVLIFWGLGCLLMLIKFIVDLNSTYKLAKEGVVPVNQQIDEILIRLAQRYKLSRPIQILKSSVVNVPVVVGWLRPVILLPIAISVGLDKAQLELIIAHELAHIKRMDFAVNVVQSLVQIFFFYHPAVHWINQVIRDEREYICDYMALNVIGNNNNSKLNLAKALLNTEELREGNFSLIAVAASGGQLKNRISHILEGEYRPATSIKALLLSAFAFMFSLAAMASTIALDNSQQRFESKKLLLAPVEISRDEAANSIVESVRLPDVYSGFEGSEGKIESRRAGVTLQTNNTAEENIKPKQNTPIAFYNLEENKADSRQDTSSTEVVDTEQADSETVLSTTASVSIEQAKIAEQAIQLDDLKHSKEPIDGQKVALPENKLNAESLMDSTIIEQQDSQIADVDKLFEQDANESFKVASLDLGSVNNYTEPKAIYTPYPNYPRRAWKKMTSQTVRVKFVIDKEGKVKNVETLGRVGKDFSREVRRKLRNWRYKPAVEKGQKVEHKASLEFIFRAPQEEKIVLISTGTHIRR